MRRGENIVARMSDLVGRTPLLEVCTTATGSRLLVKLEQFNPTGSAKVRMAREMITSAERSGALAPGGRIVEPTSGNTGLGLALIAVERGYRFTAVVDHHASAGKLRAMAAMGADLVYVGEPGTGGPSTVVRRAKAAELVAEDPTAFWPDQHNNPANRVGYRGLARELLADLFGDVDHLICAIGTGGSLCGTAAELRALGSRVRTVGVEPKGSIIFGGEPGRYWQTGSGSPAGFPVGRNVDYAQIDEGCQVGDVPAFATARVLARRTGLMMGGSAGAALYVALQRLGGLPPGSTVVTLVCDAGEKYLDSVFDDEWLRAKGLLAPDVEEEVAGLLAGHSGAVPPPRNEDAATPDLVVHP
ncbi:PLP-dependent cysteine synthase family protein [Amycolatopsis jiangsuensis]|uniref:Cystathionine beta-synthase n=1 Tax=Amycolatopsis jiangsuensis TaxID=1181879 RepID=A0A840J4A9_9PSEU|nr:cysteine synthase family protein [Amycolatopsis jiangsuensis]MBB4688693.1 cystathionine beta-synthase [Amycolatopsis jiangsuensis]